MPDNRGSPMENPVDDKFLKDRYDSELARKDKLSDSVGLPVSVLIVLAGLAVTMARGFTYAHHRLTFVFVVLVVLSGISFLCSLWNLAHAYHGRHDYERLPSLNDLYESLNEYREYYLEYPNADDEHKEQLALEDFDGNLRHRIIQAADRNAASNNNRQRRLHLGIMWLFAVLLGTLLSAVPYGIDQALLQPKTPVVHIDNLDGRKDPVMPQTPAPPQTAPDQRPKAESKPTERPKPQFPANTVFRDDKVISTPPAAPKK